MSPKNCYSEAPRRRAPTRTTRRGATAVEFALTVPIFLLFLLAAFEFGWLNVIRHTADNAAYEAARHAMVPGGTSAEAITKADVLLRVIGTRGAKITVTPQNITPETNQVTVAIDVPVAPNALVVSKFTGNRTLHSSSTLRTERAKTVTP